MKKQYYDGKDCNTKTLIINNKIIYYSYETPVVVFDITEETAYVTAKKWSNTTSRHINYVLDNLVVGEIIKKNQSEIDLLADY